MLRTSRSLSLTVTLTTGKVPTCRSVYAFLVLSSLIFGPGPSGHKRCSCSSSRGCCYQIFNVLRLRRFSTDRYESYHTYQ